MFSIPNWWIIIWQPVAFHAFLTLGQWKLGQDISLWHVAVDWDGVATTLSHAADVEDNYAAKSVVRIFLTGQLSTHSSKRKENILRSANISTYVCNHAWIFFYVCVWICMYIFAHVCIIKTFAKWIDRAGGAKSVVRNLRVIHTYVHTYIHIYMHIRINYLVFSNIFVIELNFGRCRLSLGIISPVPYNRSIFGGPSKATNITVSRPFCRTWAAVSDPDPVRSNQQTV